MYFPYQKGRYEVAPGMLPFPRDYGYGEWDMKHFQIGEDYINFRKQFELNRSREPAEKYVCFSTGEKSGTMVGEAADPAAIGAISLWMAKVLAAEYPSHFAFDETSNVFTSMINDEAFTLVPEKNEVKMIKGKFVYGSAWDALGAQAADDFAVWKLRETPTEDGAEYLEALHLNSPGHWAPQEKISRNFPTVHTPVAHIEKITPWAKSLLEGVLSKGPFVRFAWGTGTDCRLNHHPVAPEGEDPVQWGGRRFNEADPKLYTRVERQLLVGFPELKRALFFIRTYVQDVSELKKTNPEAVKGLISAIESMSPQALVYKGLAHDRDAVLAWLRKE